MINQRSERLLKIFEDKSSKGILIIDNISSDTFTKFKDVSRCYFKGSAGKTLEKILNLFLLEKEKEKLMKNNNKGSGLKLD